MASPRTRDRQRLRFHPSARGRGGFTILEMLVAVAIIGVLAAVAIPAYSRVVMNTQKAESLGKLRAIHTLFSAYAADNNGRLPAGYSEAVNPRTGRIYGTWMFQFFVEGYLDQTEDQGGSVTTMPLFSCRRQLSQLRSKPQDIRTFAMNNRIGDHPTNNPQGARTMLQMANPGRTALVLSGPPNASGTGFNTSTFENYRTRMVMDGKPYTPFEGDVLVLFADGNARPVPLDEIPVSVATGTPGFDFWLGGIRNPPR